MPSDKVKAKPIPKAVVPRVKPKPVGQVKNLNTTTKGIFEYNGDEKKKD